MTNIDLNNELSFALFNSIITSEAVSPVHTSVRCWGTRWVNRLNHVWWISMQISSNQQVQKNWFCIELNVTMLRFRLTCTKVVYPKHIQMLGLTAYMIWPVFTHKLNCSGYFHFTESSCKFSQVLEVCGGKEKLWLDLRAFRDPCWRLIKTSSLVLFFC